MTGPTTPREPGDNPTPAEARRQGLKKSRWIAAGVAVGAAAFLTGVIAGVNGADDNNADGQQQNSSVVPSETSPAPQLGDDRGYEAGDDYGTARPFDPQSGTSSQPSPQVGPQTRSGGS